MSKYIIGNRLVPPSLALAMIFGELISWNPSPIRWSRPYCSTRLLSWNIAFTCARRRSRCLLSNLISNPTLTSSVIPTGNGVSADDSMSASITLISYSGGGVGSPSGTFGGRFCATVPVTCIVDSREADWTAVNVFSSILSFFRNAWMCPVPSRSIRKAIAPRPRTVSAYPATETCSPIISAPLLTTCPMV